jgi:hypothetical protein
MTLVEEERGKRMARRVHPSPWPGVGKVIVELHGFTQTPTRVVMRALVVSEFTAEQRHRDRKRRARGIAQKTALARDALNVRLRPTASDESAACGCADPSAKSSSVRALQKAVFCGAISGNFYIGKLAVGSNARDDPRLVAPFASAKAELAA